MLSVYLIRRHDALRLMVLPSVRRNHVMLTLNCQITTQLQQLAVRRKQVQEMVVGLAHQARSSTLLIRSRNQSLRRKRRRILAVAETPAVAVEEVAVASSEPTHWAKA